MIKISRVSTLISGIESKPDTGSVDIIKDILQIFIVNSSFQENIAIYERTIETIDADDIWEKVRSILDHIRKDGYGTAAAKLEKICDHRLSIIDGARSIAPPSSHRFIKYFTHADKNKEIVSGMIEESGIVSQGYVYDGDDEHFFENSKNILTSLREKIYRKLGCGDTTSMTDKDHLREMIQKIEAAESVFEVLQNIQHMKIYKDIDISAAPKGFKYCKACWRLIPSTYVSRYNQYCELHDHTTEFDRYRSARLIIRNLNMNHPKIIRLHDPKERSSESFVKKIDSVWKPGYGGLHEDEWIDALDSISGNDLGSERFPEIHYDLSVIMGHFPNVSEFVLKEGGDITDCKSIIETLNPHLPYENEDERKQMGALYTFFAKNFWLYRVELMLAEAFLSERKKHKHGGSRPNTGGKRPGAGRKKRSQQQRVLLPEEASRCRQEKD